MYYTYENGKLVSKADGYENPSSYLQYGTNETGLNKGKANGWEQGVSDGISGVADGMGFGAIAGIGKAAYGGLKSTNSAAGDATAHFFGPHHTTFGIFDDTLAWQKNPNRTQADGAKIAKNGILNMFGLGFVADIFRGQDKRKAEAYSKYVNNVDRPFLFGIDENGMQFSKAKAAPPEPIQDKTGWIRNLGAVAGAGIKAGIDTAKQKKKQEQEKEGNKEQNIDVPKNLSFMEHFSNNFNALDEKYKKPDQSYKNADTRFDINRGDNGRDFMYNNREGSPWNTTFEYKDGGKISKESKEQMLAAIQQAEEANRSNKYEPTQIVNKSLQNVKNKYADQASEFTHNNYPVTPFENAGHNDYADALRHAGTAMYMTAGQGKWLAPLKIPYTNIMGVAHEIEGLGNYLSDTKSKTWEGTKQQFKETGSDLYNNFIGSIIGGLPIDVKNKESLLNKAYLDNYLSVLEQKKPKTNTASKLSLNFEDGGSVIVEGGKGGDDIALVDTNTGQDTGVRVEKDEMIVFSKKNVEALEQAIKMGKKNDVFSIVKDQLKQKPEVKEGEKGFSEGETVGFSGGGPYDKLTEAELKKVYKEETMKRIGKISLDNLTAIEKAMDDKGINYKEWHFLSDNARKNISDFILTPANTVKAIGWDAPLAISEKAKNYGHPIKDPDGYAKILQTKSEQMYIKRHGEPKVNLGSLQMNFDRKKLKAIEDELRARDMENIRKGKAEEVGKIMPSDNETKGDRGVDETLKLLHPEYKNAKKPIYTNFDKVENGVETWSTNGSRRDYATDNQPNTSGSSSTTSSSTTNKKQNASNQVTNIKLADYITPTGATPEDPTMLNVPKVVSGLNMPSAKVVNTEPQKQGSDFAENFLGYAGDAIKLGLGMSAASKSLPQWTVSDNWNEYMGKMKFMSNMGLTADQKSSYQDTADRTYQYDINNIYNLSNGNAGTVLGNMGRANASRYRSGVDFAMADRNAEIANNQVYGNWLAADERYRKSIFDENRNQLAMTKQAGMQLASDALANMDNRADYNKFYGKNSQVQKLQNLQLEEQQYNNDILKAQKDNFANPDFWKNYQSGKQQQSTTTSVEHQVATTNSINKDDATEQSGPKWNSKITDKILSHERSFGAPGGNPFFSGYNNSDWSNGRFEKEYVDKVRSEIPNFDSLPDKIKARLVDYKFNTGRSISDLIHVASGKYTATDANNKKTLGNLTEEQIASLNSEDFGKKIDNAKLEIYKMTKQNDVNYNKNLNMNWIPRTNMWDNFEF